MSSNLINITDLFDQMIEWGMVDVNHIDGYLYDFNHFEPINFITWIEENFENLETFYDALDFWEFGELEDVEGNLDELTIFDFFFMFPDLIKKRIIDYNINDMLPEDSDRVNIRHWFIDNDNYYNMPTTYVTYDDFGLSFIGFTQKQWEEL